MPAFPRSADTTAPWPRGRPARRPRLAEHHTFPPREKAAGECRSPSGGQLLPASSPARFDGLCRCVRRASRSSTRRTEGAPFALRTQEPHGHDCTRRPRARRRSSPEQRGERVPTSRRGCGGFLRADQTVVDVARIGERLGDRLAGDLVEHHPRTGIRARAAAEVPGECSRPSRSSSVASRSSSTSCVRGLQRADDAFLSGDTT